MLTANNYNPAKIIFRTGCTDSLADYDMPGKKALIVTSNGSSAVKTEIADKIKNALDQKGIGYVLYSKITPNPTKAQVMEGAAKAKECGCDFVIGVGGGSSIDAAKAIALMMKNSGDLWDYAYTGSGGRKEPAGAAPVVAITTTSGTGTETDPYSVITNEDTDEKFDFTNDAIFPLVSFIDPALMVSLPKNQTIYQGFDALFHVSECFITNEHENRLLDLYARDGVETVNKWLPEAVNDGSNMTARENMAYAADILAGYSMSICGTTSHHIIAQTIGGLFPNIAHGLTLLFVAEEYYKKVGTLRPELIDELGEFMGIDDCHNGTGFVKGLTALMDKTGCRHMSMSEYGIKPADLAKIAEMTVDNTGIEWEKYTLTKQDILEILEKSYR